MNILAIAQASRHPGLISLALLTVVLIVAAVIDGRQLRVPNWLTFPLIVAGWGYHFWAGGWGGLGWSLLGTAVGLALLLLPYAVGGMGAGDVKLLAGIGAWMLPRITVYAFAWSAMAGGLLAVAMVLWERQVRKHLDLFQRMVIELAVIRDPGRLSAIAAARKPSMTLLPYAIPLALGSIGYFIYAGLLPVF